MFKRILPKILIVFWMLLLLAFGTYYLLFAPRDSVYSDTENRELAGFPTVSFQSVFSGKFGEEFETYLLDRFPLRNGTVIAVNRLESFLSLASHNDYLLIADDADDPLENSDFSDDLSDLLNNFSQADSSEESSGTSSEPVSEDSSEPQGENPPIVPKPPAKPEDFPAQLGVYMDTGYGAVNTNAYSRNNVAAVTAVLNKYADLLPKDGKLMFTVVPQSSLANRFVNSKTQNAFYADWDDVVNGLGRDNVYAFDTAEILSEHIKNGEYVYFRTDMHWNPYGSYLVYKEMAEMAGKTPCLYTDFDLTVEEPFRGTYYRDNPSAYMGVQPDRLDLLMPKFDFEWRRITSGDEYKVIDFLDFDARANDRYTVYLGGPAGPWTYAKCNNGETEKCLVITDSFGLGFIPFLTANYGEVHYYDTRYFNSQLCGGSVAELMEKHGIQDVYVVVGDLHSFNSGFLLSNANTQLGK